MDFRKSLNKFSVITLSLSVICGGLVFYKWITIGIGFELFYTTPFFVVFYLLYIFSARVKRASGSYNYFNGILFSIVIYFIAATGIYLYQSIKDKSPNILICEYIDDDKMIYI